MLSREVGISAIEVRLPVFFSVVDRGLDECIREYLPDR